VDFSLEKRGGVACVIDRKGLSKREGSLVASYIGLSRVLALLVKDSPHPIMYLKQIYLDRYVYLAIGLFNARSLRCTVVCGGENASNGRCPWQGRFDGEEGAGVGHDVGDVVVCFARRLQWS